MALAQSSLNLSVLIFSSTVGLLINSNSAKIAGI